MLDINALMADNKELAKEILEEATNFDKTALTVSYKKIRILLIVMIENFEDIHNCKIDMVVKTQMIYYKINNVPVDDIMVTDKFHTLFASMWTTYMMVEAGKPVDKKTIKSIEERLKLIIEDMTAMSWMNFPPFDDLKCLDNPHTIYNIRA